MIEFHLKDFFIQLCIFLSSLIILWKFVFVHIDRIYRERIGKTLDLDNETGRLHEDIQGKIAFLKQRINEARDEAAKIKEILIQKAKEETSHLIAESRKEANETMSRELQKIYSEYATLKKDLSQRIDGFKKELLKEYLN